jgi:hypothetical protein
LDTVATAVSKKQTKISKMKKLSREEMKNVMGGYLQPPPSGCYGQNVICTYPYPNEDQVCCGGLSCIPNAGHVYTCQPI